MIKDLNLEEKVKETKEKFLKFDPMEEASDIDSGDEENSGGMVIENR